MNQDVLVRLERMSATPLTRRDALRGAMAGSLALGLAACGSSSGGGAAGKGTISALSWVFLPGPTGGGLYGAFDDLRKDYARSHRGLKIRYDNAPIADYSAALATRIRGNALEDIPMLLAGSQDAAAWPALVQQPKSAYGDLANQLTLWEGAATNASGKYFGVPLGVQTPIWYYNTSAFEKAGLDPSKPPTTWDDFATACDKLAKAGITPIAIDPVDGYSPFEMYVMWFFQLLPDEDDQAAIRTGKLRLTDTRFSTALSYMAQTYKRGWWGKDYAGKTGVDLTGKFIAGQYGFLCGYAVGLNDYKGWDAKIPHGYGVMGAPVIPGASQSVLPAQPVFIMAISKRSQQRQAAADFIAFLASKQGQTKLFTVGGQLPNRNDIDIPSLSKSVGAQGIAKLLTELAVVVPNGIKSPATAEMLKNLVPAVTSGNFKRFLQDVDHQQQSA